MYRVRLHGRGGQGIKTAGRVLGSAFFAEGFEVQDAPRYGAERRGAAIFSYVRADRHPIHERGVILRPDLVVVADDTLIGVPGAGVTVGLHARAVVLAATSMSSDALSAKLHAPSMVLTLQPGDPRHVGVRVAGAAARLLGVISRGAVEQAIEEELGEVSAAARAASREAALAAYDEMASEAGVVKSLPREGVLARPDWIELPADVASVAAPVVHGGVNMAPGGTGLWRTLRPVVNESACHRCVWICGTMCPDGAITVGPSGHPRVDLEHCKGCMICVAECPSHAIQAVPEHGLPAGGAADAPGAEVRA
jgi:pyruvate ferredoxin oxidoreductase gamma subunit